MLGYGHIEIGDQDNIGFLVRALDYGGLHPSLTLESLLSTIPKRISFLHVRVLC
jgi:hypothetical protein